MFLFCIFRSLAYLLSSQRHSLRATYKLLGRISSGLKLNKHEMGVYGSTSNSYLCFSAFACSCLRRSRSSSSLSDSYSGLSALSLEVFRSVGSLFDRLEAFRWLRSDMSSSSMDVEEVTGTPTGIRKTLLSCSGVSGSLTSEMDSRNRNTVMRAILTSYSWLFMKEHPKRHGKNTAII